MKRIFSLVLITVMLLGIFVMPVSANEGIRVYLNGTELQFDVPPQLINDRTMVPLRVIFEALGATVDWDDPTQTVKATKGAKIVVMQINNNEITVDGNKITLDVPPQLVDSRTLVPVRAVAESFGAQVDWVDETQSVVITSDTPSVTGVVNNYVYENPFVGISIKFDSNWDFETREEMEETEDIVGNYIREEYKGVIGNDAVKYDVSATNVITGDNINVCIEKYGNDEKENASAEDMYKEIVPAIEQAYKNMGATDFNYEIVKDSIKGKPVTALIVGVKIGGVTLYQLQFALKCDSYIANVTFTSLSAEGVISLLERIEWMNSRVL